MKKNRILYLALLFTAFIFPYFYGGRLPYLVLYIVLALPAITFLHALIIMFRFKYVQFTDKVFIVKGDIVKFSVRITNEDFFLYPYIKAIFVGEETVFEKQVQSINFSLLPNSRKTYTFDLECKYRGEYEIGLKYFEIMDLLGIFRLRYNVKEMKRVVVYPKITNLDYFDLRTNYIAESRNILDTFQEDMTSISNIRTYAYGDTLKKIHWKLTAKKGELMVKEFQNTSEAGVVIILDLFRYGFDLETNTIMEDKVIECCVCLANYCLQRWIPTSLVFYDNRIVEISAANPLDFQNIYQLLSVIRFDQQVSVADLLDVWLRRNFTETNLVIITSNLSYELFDKIYKANTFGYAVSLIYVSPEELTQASSVEIGQMLEYLPEINVQTYKINVGDRIESILEKRF